jgi:hypothetical protein
MLPTVQAITVAIDQYAEKALDNRAIQPNRRLSHRRAAK